MFGPERIETLISELNEFAEEEDDTLARLTMVDIYQWVYDRNRGSYKPTTKLSTTATKRFPQLTADLNALRGDNQ